MSSYSSSSGIYSGYIVTRKTDTFAGVDFSNSDTSLARSPDSLNMWKNYKTDSDGLETRPDVEILDNFDDIIYGFFFFDYNDEIHQIVHSGKKLYDNKKLIYSDMNEQKSQSFIYGNIFYIKDGKNYLEYDGTNIKTVEGTVPITTIGKAPEGSGTTYQDVNLLTAYRKNSFCSDGESLTYQLDVEYYDGSVKSKVWINDELVDNSTKQYITDGNGYYKYQLDTTVYWYDDVKKQLYNSDYEKIVDGTLVKTYNERDYVKYTDSDDVVYWVYDSTVYDSDFLSTSKSVSDLTIVTAPSVALSSLTQQEGYPYTEYPDKGQIVFSSPPSAPLTAGQDNVIIQFSKKVEGYREKIDNCTILEVFDNRAFFSGNKDYPNQIFHSSLDDPRYCSDLDYYNEGLDSAMVKSMVAGNNALWVFKEPSQANTSVFYHTPTIDSDYGKVYPSTHSNISEGCVATGINFRDDIVFFSSNGMEGISGDVTSEQIIAHRSSMVDGKLLQETNYNNLMLEEWEGYLLVIVDNKIYLADSSQQFTNITHTEYEWYYWEFDFNIVCTAVKNGILYLCSEKEIYSLTNNESEINSYWTTKHDDFKYPHYQKTTNKRGGTAEAVGNKIRLDVRIDEDKFEKVNEYKATSYIVYRVKKKKWKRLQLKFSSTKPFTLKSYTMECYVGGYIKR